MERNDDTERCPRSVLRIPCFVLRSLMAMQVEDAQRPRTLSGIVPDFRRVNSVVQKVFQHKVFSVSFPLNDDLIFLSIPPSFQLISIQGDYKKKPIFNNPIFHSIYGMEWNGMEWNGMEWNGIKLYLSTLLSSSEDVFHEGRHTI